MGMAIALQMQMRRSVWSLCVLAMLLVFAKPVLAKRSYGPRAKEGRKLQRPWTSKRVHRGPRLTTIQYDHHSRLATLVRTRAGVHKSLVQPKQQQAKARSERNLLNLGGRSLHPVIRVEQSPITGGVVTIEPAKSPKNSQSTSP